VSKRRLYRRKTLVPRGKIWELNTDRHEDWKLRTQVMDVGKEGELEEIRKEQ
jgi:hypothetical protein